MKCAVCKKEISGSLCDRCKFPRIVVVGGSEDDPLVKKAARDYREHLLKGIRIELETYQYREVNGELELGETKRISLGEELERLSQDGIRWFPKLFARGDAGEDMTLTLYFTSVGNEKIKKLHVQSPDIQSLWKVGLKALDGLDFSVVIGGESDYVETESFCVLDETEGGNGKQN